MDGQEINYGQITRLSRNVQLRNVFVSYSTFERHADVAIDGDVARLSYSHRPAALFYRLHPEQQSLQVTIEYHLRAIQVERGLDEPDKQDVKPLFEVVSRWQVEYAIVAELESDIDHEVAADFAYANAQLNAYPYVRAFITDLTGRANLPPLVMPVFTVPKTRPVNLVRGEIYRIGSSDSGDTQAG